MKQLRRIISVLAALLVCIICSATAENGTEPAIETPSDEIWSILAEQYESAATVAAWSPELGRGFTDHKAAHAEMVSVKSVEVAAALQEAASRGTLPVEGEKDRIPFSAHIDLNTVAAAGLAHDTGMNGDGFAIDVEDDPNGDLYLSVREDGMYNMHRESINDFSEIRTYHSLNSCLHVLILREEYRAAGFSDVQIDKIATECAAHSKSSSGVRDLHSREDWAECFDRIDSIVEVFNREWSDHQISFDRTAFETDDALMSELITETLALRVGDVSRDSGPDAEVQTGEHVHVDRSTLNNRGDSEEAELENAVITFTETGEPVLEKKGRQVHAGEQNIVFNRTYADEAGIVTHEITVADGCSAPRCTQSSVGDHLGEFYSARDGKFNVRIIFEQFEADDDGFFRSSWEDFRMMAANDYPNVDILFPWDEEVSE